MTNFYLGQKVVCINDAARGGEAFRPRLSGLTKNEIYTVAELYEEEHGIICIRVEELRQHWRGPRLRRGYYIWRFRPLKSTSIDIFHKMCKNDPATNKLELMRKELQDA